MTPDGGNDFGVRTCVKTNAWSISEASIEQEMLWINI